jgi:hypothetical protein
LTTPHRRSYLGTSVKRLPHMAAKIQRITATATVVLAGSEPIASELRLHSPNTHLSPTCVALGPTPQRSYAGSAGELRLVWTGTASNARNLALAYCALRRLSDRMLVRVELVTRLADVPMGLLADLPGVRLTEWSEASQADALNQADVAFAPLVQEVSSWPPVH